MNWVQDLPNKLFLEPTTRCNFCCEMCVKQSAGIDMVEGDLSIETLNGLVPAMCQLKAAILGGIGEPLLNPNLELFISTIKTSTPDSCWIGVQSNGSLLTKDRLQSLIEAGMTNYCLSVDSTSPDLFKEVRNGGDLESITQAIELLHSAKKRYPSNRFSFGIEVVLRKDNIQDLCSIVQWVAEKGASYVLASHLLPYSKSMISQCLNSPNLNISRDLYNDYKAQASKKRLNLDHYLQQRWRYHWNTSKTIDQKSVQNLGESFTNEALEKHIPLHYQNLIGEDPVALKEIKNVFKNAIAIAKRSELELKLPELSPKHERVCHFIEDKSLFVAWDGNIYPCYFLWHQYVFYQNNLPVKVTAKSFGDVNERDARTIWNDSEYRSFRDKVKQYDYPYCGNCNLGPCNLFTAKEFEYDCYAIEVPCGICPWCGGLLQCLQ